MKQYTNDMERSGARDESDETIAALVSVAPELFSVIIDRYETRLGRYVSRITRIDQAGRDEILQEVFLKVYKNINAFNIMTTYLAFQTTPTEGQKRKFISA